VRATVGECPTWSCHPNFFISPSPPTQSIQEAEANVREMVAQGYETTARNGSLSTPDAQQNNPCFVCVAELQFGPYKVRLRYTNDIDLMKNHGFKEVACMQAGYKAA